MDSANAPQIDVGTLLLATALFGLMNAVFAWSAARAMPRWRGALHEWTVAMLAATAGSLLFHLRLRGTLPWLLAFPGANALVLLMIYSAARAHARLFDLQVRHRLALALAAAGLAGMVAVQGFGAPPPVAVFTMSFALAGLAALAAAAVFAGARRDGFRLPELVSLAVCALTALAFAARAAIAVFGDATSVLPTAQSAPQVGVTLVGTMFVVGASLAFFAMVHERQRRAIEEGVQRDELTGLYTRRAFFDRAAAHLRLPGRGEVAVVMLDIDHFKAVNDRHGHVAGDLVLAHAGRLIGSLARTGDVAGRYGGEEFCVLLKDCGPDGAADFAQRLLHAARAHGASLRDGRSVDFTFSVGFAHEHGVPGSRTLEQLVEAADAGLYAAKRGGRDRVGVAAAAGWGTGLSSGQAGGR